MQISAALAPQPVLSQTVCCALERSTKPVKQDQNGATKAAMKFTAEDIKFAKEMTKLEWALSRHMLLPAGSSPKDEQILGAVSCEFAQKCILDLIARMKPEFLRVHSTSTNQESHSEEQPHNGGNSSSCSGDTNRLNFVKHLRPSVMILGAGWKAAESSHISFVEVQGMSLRKVTDYLVRSPANWSQVGQIMLLPDAMWSWRSNFQGLSDFVSILKHRSPMATIYLCGIPIFDPSKVEPWQLHWIKLFNQFVFKIANVSTSQNVQVFYVGKFIKEHKTEWQPGKPYYAKPEAVTRIVAALVKVFEHLAEKRLGIRLTSLNKPAE